MGKRKQSPIKTTLIKDLPQETQDWLNNLKPPPNEMNKPNYTQRQKKRRGGG